MGAGICLFLERGKWDFQCTETGMHETKTVKKWEWDYNLSNTGWDCGI